MATIVTRAGKGSALTWTEGDANITNLNNDKIELTNLSVTTDPASGGGTLTYNNTTGAFNFAPADQLESSRNLYIYGKASEAINKGEVVMFGGVQGDHVLLVKADVNAIGFIEDWIIGIANETLAINDFSYIVTQGTVENFDTATNFNEGDILYVDTTTAGALTNVEPTAPNPKISMAAVTKEDVTEGIVLVRPRIFFNLYDLNDVNVTTPNNGDILSWNSGTSTWQAGAPAAGGLANIVEDTSPQLGGTLDGQDNTVQAITLKDYAETVYSLGSNDSPSIDVANGNVQSLTISAGLALPDFTSASAGQSVTLLVSGSGNATGTANYKFAGGSKTLTNDSVVSIFYDGTTYWTSISTDFTV